MQDGEQEEEPEEECEECDLKDVPVGIANEICKIADETDGCECEELLDLVIKEEISVDEYIDKVEEHVKNDPNALHTISEVRKFYEEAKKKHNKE